MYCNDFLVVSVNGQLLPRTLQAWQETSSSLLRNQTKIQEDIQEIQGSIRYLWSNFSSYCLYQHNDDSHDHNDKKLVADFGAKIEAMFSDLDNVRDHYESINNERINLEQLIGDLKVGEANDPQRCPVIPFDPKENAFQAKETIFRINIRIELLSVPNQIHFFFFVKPPYPLKNFYLIDFLHLSHLLIA